jgi:hypothetical protein
MSDIHLNFINQSNDRNNSDIVIFQKNVAVSFEEIAVAWTVIQNCGQGWNHPFVYPSTMTVAASDSYGNFSPQLTASFGQQFSVVEQTSGDTLILNDQSSASVNEIELLNGLHMGAINANIYKDGRLLATKTSIAPGQKAVFEFKPTIWIGVVSQIGEGDVMNSAILSNVNTEISLLGIKSADIVMTGGGPGAESTPFMFSLQNVVYA